MTTKKPVTKILAIKDIFIEPDVMSRAGDPDKATIAAYAQVMKDAVEEGTENPFPALIVSWDEKTKRYLVVDGVHRLLGAQSAGLTSFTCEVFEESVKDAFLRSVAANQKHGLRRSNADKTYCVNRLLGDPEWGMYPNTKIAELAGVSNTFVAKLRTKATLTEGFVTPKLKAIINPHTKEVMYRTNLDEQKIKEKAAKQEEEKRKRAEAAKAKEAILPDWNIFRKLLKTAHEDKVIPQARRNYLQRFKGEIDLILEGQDPLAHRAEIAKKLAEKAEKEAREEDKSA